MRFPENAPRNPDELLERRDGLQHVSASGAIGFELGPSVQTAHLERNVIYLVRHLTHRGALWASGAAQAGHVVRIILYS